MITSNLTGVVCGNSDVLLDQLIDEGVHFDLILTDPPYNINKDFGNKSDCLPLDEFIAITAERMSKIKKLLEPNKVASFNIKRVGNFKKPYVAAIYKRTVGKKIFALQIRV